MRGMSKVDRRKASPTDNAVVSLLACSGRLTTESFTASIDRQNKYAVDAFISDV